MKSTNDFHIITSDNLVSRVSNMAYHKDQPVDCHRDDVNQFSALDS